MSHVIEVCDVGARYGLHPSWQGLQDFDISFHLVEADSEEAERLRTKFSGPRGHNSFSIHRAFLGLDGGEGSFYQLSNRAMSGSFMRKRSRLYSGERAVQTGVEKICNLRSQSVDKLLNGVAIDFIKLDTEGSELQILTGAENMLKASVIGIRAEVSINEVFDGAPTYTEVNSFVRDRGFDILNIDYTGKGDLQHSFVSQESRYGILNSTDVVWLHRDFIRFPFVPPSDIGSLIRTLKAVVFVFSNHSADLGLALLSESRHAISRFLDDQSVASLLMPLSRRVEHHLYSLKWVPGQSIEQHARWFKETFFREMRTGTNFMSALDLNP